MKMYEHLQGEFSCSYRLKYRQIEDPFGPEEIIHEAYVVISVCGKLRVAVIGETTFQRLTDSLQAYFIPEFLIYLFTLAIKVFFYVSLQCEV